MEQVREGAELRWCFGAFSTIPRCAAPKLLRKCTRCSIQFFFALLFQIGRNEGKKNVVPAAVQKLQCENVTK